MKDNIAVVAYLRGIPEHISKKYNLKQVIKDNKNCFEANIYTLYGDDFIAIELPYTGTAYNRSLVNNNRRNSYIFNDFIVAKIDRSTGKYIAVTKEDMPILKKLVTY